MATCKLCGISGLFLSVSNLGLCARCNPIAQMDIQNRTRIISDSRKILDQSTKPATLLSSYDLIIEQVDALVSYERKGIRLPMSPAPSEIFHRLVAERDNTILRILQDEYQAAINKSKLGATSAAKVNPISKFVLAVDEYKKRVANPAILSGLQDQAKSLFIETQLQIFIETAQRAELKGQRKKALDTYYDAFYFLTHDDVDDAGQRREINMIRGKIIELGGSLGEPRLQ